MKIIISFFIGLVVLSGCSNQPTEPLSPCAKHEIEKSFA